MSDKLPDKNKEDSHRWVAPSYSSSEIEDGGLVVEVTDRLSGAKLFSSVVNRTNWSVEGIDGESDRKAEPLSRAIFTNEMIKFSSIRGIDPKGFILYLAALYGNKIRIFYQEQYSEDEMREDDFFDKIFSGVEGNIPVVNIFLNHTDIILKVGDKVVFFDTQLSGNPPFSMNLSPLENILYDLHDVHNYKINDNVVFLFKEEFQGSYSCFLMVSSFLKLYMENEDFKNNLKEYFENGYGQLLLTEQLFNLIEPDNKILKVSKTDDDKIKISSAFIENDNINIREGTFLFFKDIGRWIPIENLVKIDALNSVISTVLRNGKFKLGGRLDGYSKPFWLDFKLEEQKLSDKKDISEDEINFQKLLNRYFSIMTSSESLCDYYFDNNEQNAIKSHYRINELLLRHVAKVENNTEVLFVKSSQNDKTKESGRIKINIKTVVEQHNFMIVDNNSYVSVNFFVNPTNGKLEIQYCSVPKKDSIDGYLDNYFDFSDFKVKESKEMSDISINSDDKFLPLKSYQH